VSRGWAEPACDALGGGNHERIPRDVELSLTAVTPGVPLIVRRTSVLVKVLCSAM
jgi:hypothetical protein